jgi:hypothetical protein
MPTEQRCSLRHCRDRILTPFSAFPLVFLGSTLGLAFPMIDALGINLRLGVFSQGPNFPAILLLVLVWLTSFFIGIYRKHEGPFTCFFDSLSIPAIVLVATEAHRSLFGG